MKAAVLYEVRQPLRIEELEMPEFRARFASEERGRLIDQLQSGRTRRRAAHGCSTSRHRAPPWSCVDPSWPRTMNR